MRQRTWLSQDFEERVRAYFRVKLGAQDAQWGTA